MTRVTFTAAIPRFIAIPRGHDPDFPERVPTQWSLQRLFAEVGASL
jgi:hypothetical protein